MAWNQSYIDICREIELWEIRLDELKRELSMLRMKMHSPPRTKLTASYSGMPGGSQESEPFERLWRRAAELSELIEEATDILHLKKEAKKRMESRMSEYDGLEYQVAYLRDVKRMRLRDIANEVGFSYDWIKRISMRVPRVKEKIPS